MKIAPIDIVHKHFSKSLMGFSADEVTEFLQLLAHQMEVLIQEKNSLKEALREKELNLMEYKERDQVLKSTISTATQMTERLKQDSEREAKLILADANQKAELIVRDSRDSLKKAYQEINDIKRMRMQFEANLKALAQAHLTLLEQGEKYLPQMQLPQHQFQVPMNSNLKVSADVSPLSVDPS
ncbi:MAG: DivIVA domain-containing protein [Pseudobdellovibrionaceae bacterium]